MGYPPFVSGRMARGGALAAATGGGGGATPFGNLYSSHYDGINDYMTVTPSSNIILYGLSMWFSCDTAVDISTVRGVLFGPDGGLNWFLGLGGNFTSTLTDELISINTGARYGYGSADAADTIATGWHHVVAAWSTSSATNGGADGYDIYLDGAKVGNIANTTYGAATLFTLASGTAFYMGLRSAGSFPYAGLIDEVAIFDSTISATDVTTMWNDGNGPTDLEDLEPAGWWRMGDNDGGEGETVTDLGSGENDGTLNGATFSEDVPT